MTDKNGALFAKGISAFFGVRRVQGLRRAGTPRCAQGTRSSQPDPPHATQPPVEQAPAPTAPVPQEPETTKTCFSPEAASFVIAPTLLPTPRPSPSPPLPPFPPEFEAPLTPQFEVPSRMTAPAREGGGLHLAPPRPPPGWRSSPPVSAPEPEDRPPEPPPPTKAAPSAKATHPESMPAVRAFAEACHSDAKAAPINRATGSASSAGSTPPASSLSVRAFTDTGPSGPRFGPESKDPAKPLSERGSLSFGAAKAISAEAKPELKTAPTPPPDHPMEPLPGLPSASPPPLVVQPNAPTAQQQADDASPPVIRPSPPPPEPLAETTPAVTPAGPPTLAPQATPGTSVTPIVPALDTNAQLVAFGNALEALDNRRTRDVMHTVLTAQQELLATFLQGLSDQRHDYGDALERAVVRLSELMPESLVQAGEVFHQGTGQMSGALSRLERLAGNQIEKHNQNLKHLGDLGRDLAQLVALATELRDIGRDLAERLKSRSQPRIERRLAVVPIEPDEEEDESSNDVLAKISDGFEDTEEDFHGHH